MVTECDGSDAPARQPRVDNGSHDRSDGSVLAPVVRHGSLIHIRGKHGGEAEITLALSNADSGLYRLPPRSPLARALIGRRAGDEVYVHTDAGTAKFTIMWVAP